MVRRTKASNCERTVEFLQLDFKEISAKLESTDKKMQFCVQLYITLITAVLAAQGEKLLEKLNKKEYLFLAVLMLVFYVIGQFILFYMLSGQKMHFEYVNRLNFIRRKIFEKNGEKKEFIESYGYTSHIEPKIAGMNYWMIYLVTSSIVSFAIISILLFREHYKLKGLDGLSLILVVLFFNITIIVLNHSKMREMKWKK